MGKLIQPLKGFTIVPAGIGAFGEVVFTDGISLMPPNQRDCEAYGYTYDETSNTCYAYKHNTNLATVLENTNNKISGAGNRTATGTNNTYIMGENNTVNGFSRNNVVIGNNNEIVANVNNANVFGTLGEVTATNSIVLGGNAEGDSLGERQTMTMIFGRQTDVGTNKASFLNNTTDSYFAVPDNTILFFHAYVVAVRVGGTAGGSVGDYASWVERGVVINKSGTLSVSRERDAIKNSGTVTGWQPTGAILGTDFYIKVKGAANMTIEWASTVTFTQIKTGVAL
jgi:hypothetical protein